MKLLREPLAHFLVIGAAIFVLYGLMGQQDAEEQERAITISAAQAPSCWTRRSES